MKTFLALLLLIPSLSWGDILEQYLCSKFDEELNEINLLFLFKFENYFKDDSNNKYFFEDDNEKYYTLWDDSKSPKEVAIIFSKGGGAGIHFYDNEKPMSCSISHAEIDIQE